MAVTTQASGTQAATIGTEHTLADVNVTGTFVLSVDTVNMAAGDYLELRIYKMTLTAGTRRVAYFAVFQDAQSADDLIKVAVPISNVLTDSGALRFTLKQVAGTGRNFDWCLERHN